jgi:pyruvate/2-oxoglutarate dehydrogenase complex dihydrolipoamide dehydrogenase (E3) component
MTSFMARIVAAEGTVGNGKLKNCIRVRASSTLPSMSQHQFDFDVAILGGGSGGYAAARTAAARKLRTVVIDGANELGGLCILRGCMPTKALLYAAEVRHLAKASSLWGMQSTALPFSWSAVSARKDAVIKDFADFRVGQLNSGRFELIRAQAKFIDPHSVELGDGRRLSAAHFVISTGSVVGPAPVPELDSIGYLDSDAALKLNTLPKSLIVLGGGAIAVEFAQLFARFDVEVTLVQRSNQLLKDFDPDAAAAVEAAFRREGIRVFTGTQLTSARRNGSEKIVSFQHDGEKCEVAADEILFALGRAPNTAGLQLERAGVETAKGRVVTNAQMQSSAPHIYAAGDCTGPHEIVHIAIQQGEIAAHNIANPTAPRAIDYRLLISVVFTDPHVAAVGLTEKAAKDAGVAYLAASYPFNDHGKSIIMGVQEGFVKLLADPKSGEILGGSCVGPSGGELIHEIIVAMAKRMTVHELAATPHYHPTLAEIWTYPAEELADQIPL